MRRRLHLRSVTDEERHAVERLSLGPVWQDFDLVFATDIGMPFSSRW
jgi:hypothetical protein